MVREAIDVEIPPFDLAGTLTLPTRGSGIVLFAHGSGSGRFSPRNRHVARGLQTAGLGTLLFDLLTEPESMIRANVFDIALLADRLLAATYYIRTRDDTAAARIGYFGASTGAGAALVAAARGQDDVSAVVSRGGRPDLAGGSLPKVRAATLLIVGSLDHGVIELNEEAYAKLGCEKRLEIVPGAGHLFEEPGTLDQVIYLARDWFAEHLQ
ncbi:dienelactone hydrolase family protein [Sphingomonas oleivorans]|nr:dienelactone hydrolase family protein [Sphingomonas oleivorans]